MPGRKTLEVLAAAALAVAPVAAQAQLTVGLRVAYAPAVGHAYGGFKDVDTGQSVPASMDLAWQIPVQLDVLVRFLPHLAAGPYVSYGFAKAADRAVDGACMSGSSFSCSVRVVRAGLQVVYTFGPGATPLVPWIGAGAGWEWTTLQLTGPTRPFSIDLNGVELANLQLGADYRATRWLGVGPYVGYSLGRYRAPGNADLLKGLEPTKSAVHGWLSVGVRGTLDL